MTDRSALPPLSEDDAALLETLKPLDQIEEFHELYHLAQAEIGADRLDVRLNGRTVPLTRELWLP